MRAWLAMFLGFVACTGDGSEVPTDSGEPSPTTEPTDVKTKGEALLERVGEYELRGESWTGRERLRLYEDDLFAPRDVCVISYTMTGTRALECTECAESQVNFNNSGAAEFVISEPTVETELYAGACNIVLGAPSVDVGEVDDLDGSTLIYGWGEEPTNHGYALFQQNSAGDWFVSLTMGYPWENVDGVLDQLEVDAYMTFTILEGSYAF